MSRHVKICYFLSKIVEIRGKSRKNGCKCAESRLHTFSHSGRDDDQVGGDDERVGGDEKKIKLVSVLIEYKRMFLVLLLPMLLVMV